VFELSLCLNVRNELIRAYREKQEIGSDIGQFGAPKSPADSRNLNPTRNGTMERSNRCKHSQNCEEIPNMRRQPTASLATEG
jgi:hypothetical protein